MQTNRKGFLKLLERYLKNRVTDNEKQMMDIWYDTIQREEEQGQSVLADNEIKTQMWRDIRSRMHRKVQGSPQVQASPNDTERRWWQVRYYQVAAASAILLLSFVFYRAFIHNNTLLSGTPDFAIASMIKESNPSAFVKKILLSDGSRVTLDPGAALFYPKEFEREKRVVYLKGNGFFNITKDPERPFLVYTDNILTKVLGTSFKIVRDHTRGFVEVSVATGKVLVEKVTNGNTGKAFTTNKGVLLTPNKKVIYYTDSEKYIVSLVEKPQIIEKEEEYRKPESFIFRGAPLSLVLSRLEKAYGVQIVVNGERVKDCVITADLSQDDLYGKLEIICAAVNAKFELKEDKINLTGQGCNANE